MNVFIGYFPVPNGDFETFDHERFDREVDALVALAHSCDAPHDVRLVVFSRNEATRPEVRPEWDGGPPHALTPSELFVRRHRLSAPCYIDTYMLSVDDAAHACAEALRFVEAQGGIGLVALFPGDVLSPRLLAHHLDHHFTHFAEVRKPVVSRVHDHLPTLHACA